MSASRQRRSMAHRPMSAAIFPNGWRRPLPLCSATRPSRRAGRSPPARRLTFASTRLKATREKAQAALAHLGATPTPLSPLGLRLPLSRRRPQPFARGRAGLCQRARRNPGRRFAACGSPLRRATWRASARSLRGRRRQDAGLGRGDGKPWPDLCDGPRRPAARRTLSAGWKRPAPAMSKSARRDAAAIISPISRAAAISCSLMRPARERAPGGAIRMRNGAYAPARLRKG